MREEEEEECQRLSGGVHAKYQLALVYPRSRLLSWPSYDSDSRVHTFRHSWGFSQFISVKWLELLGSLKDDCIAVRCDITVVEKSVVKDEFVKAADMARLGMLYKCKDDLCKRHHRRPAETGKKLRKAFVSFFRSIR
ncbi:unnamed protein product [Miscanthus lutarioriparius]|uniref:Uncharacterized protein n=1 Tax=Miscanthus lutarioriparius TaxID=422564 RepID=A0A811NBK5_9POAL|nr:unnamed protein product [Miscanthus lutarioriparius]